MNSLHTLNDTPEESAHIGEIPSTGSKHMFTYQGCTRVSCKQHKNLGLCREIDVSVLL